MKNIVNGCQTHYSFLLPLHLLVRDCFYRICLSVSKITENRHGWIFAEFREQVDCGPESSGLDFGSDAGHIPDSLHIYRYSSSRLM